MQDEIHSLAALPATGQFADIARDKSKPRPLSRADQRPDFVQIILFARGEVIQADDGLIELEQGFEQVGTNEPGNPGHQPHSGPCGKLRPQIVVSRHRGFTIYDLNFVSCGPINRKYPKCQCKRSPQLRP